MSGQALTYWSSKFGKNVPHVTEFLFRITGAGTFEAICAGQPGVFSEGAISQAAIDAELGSSSEFTTAKFDAVAMGVDAFGGVVNFNGQIEKLLAVESSFLTATAVASGVETGAESTQAVACHDTGLTDSSLTTQATVSSSGNLGFRAIILGLDAATSGILSVKVKWISK